MTEQKERLKKLYALALRGVGGEKEQAQAILDKLLKKYAMTLDCPRLKRSRPRNLRNYREGRGRAIKNYGSAENGVLNVRLWYSA